MVPPPIVVANVIRVVGVLLLPATIVFLLMSIVAGTTISRPNASKSLGIWQIGLTSFLLAVSIQCGTTYSCWSHAAIWTTCWICSSSGTGDQSYDHHVSWGVWPMVKVYGICIVFSCVTPCIIFLRRHCSLNILARHWDFGYWFRCLSPYVRYILPPHPS